MYTQRDKVVAACELKPGMVVADVGTGTGLFTRLFAKEVGADGQVFAVDIAPKFLEHVQKTSREAGLRTLRRCCATRTQSTCPPNSVDLAFVCDTYHHFEFPAHTLVSLHRRYQPGGRLVVVDFLRDAGKSSDWVLNHVRAGQGIVEKEITAAGFEKSDEVKELLKENYFVVFTKRAGPQPGPRDKTVTPVVEGYGAVVPIPEAAEQPAKGSKVVIEATGMGKDPAQPLPGLVRAATLLNLAGASGLKTSDLEVVVVLHGDATSAALDDAAYKELTGREHPHADVMKKLKAAGVKFLVCGQALARKGYDPKRVSRRCGGRGLGGLGRGQPPGPRVRLRPGPVVRGVGSGPLAGCLSDSSFKEPCESALERGNAQGWSFRFAPRPHLGPAGATSSSRLPPSP